MVGQTIVMRSFTDFMDQAIAFCIASGIDPDRIVSESLVECGKTSAAQQMATEMAMLVMRVESDNEEVNRGNTDN